VLETILVVVQCSKNCDGNENRAQDKKESRGNRRPRISIETHSHFRPKKERRLTHFNRPVDNPRTDP